MVSARSKTCWFLFYIIFVEYTVSLLPVVIRVYKIMRVNINLGRREMQISAYSGLDSQSRLGVFSWLYLPTLLHVRRRWRRQRCFFFLFWLKTLWQYFFDMLGTSRTSLFRPSCPWPPPPLHSSPFRWRPSMVPLCCWNQWCALAREFHSSTSIYAARIKPLSKGCASFDYTISNLFLKWNERQKKVCNIHV